MYKNKDFNSNYKPTWCPGCGDFAVWNSIKTSLAKLNIAPHDAVTVFGIGCSGNMANTIGTYAIHAIHGRAVPVASGVKLANHKLTVLAIGGDGDGYGIGMGHFIHACRRNIDMTYIVSDNQIYGLTTGQYSPTSSSGTISKTTPHDGAIEQPVHPVGLALSAGASFVARGFSGDPEHLTGIIERAIAHKGFAHVDIFQPCVTFNKVNTYSYYRDRVYKLEDEKHDTSSFKDALLKSHEWGDKIPYGVFYEEVRPTYESQVEVLKKGPLVDRIPDKGFVDVSKTLDHLQ